MGVVVLQVAFWVSCFSVISMTTQRSAQDNMEAFNTTLEKDIEHSEQLSASSLRLEFYNSYRPGADEDMPALFDALSKNSDADYCAMDNNGNLYLPGGRVLKGLGFGPAYTVGKKGYAVVYMADWLGQKDCVATAVYISHALGFSVVRVESMESYFSRIFSDISIEADYIAFYNEWGEEVAVHQAADSAAAQSVQSGALTLEIRTDGAGYQKANNRWDYNLYIPMNQPDRWFIGMRVSNRQVVPMHDTIVGVFLQAATLVGLTTTAWIVWDWRQEKRFGAARRNNIDPLTGLLSAPGFEEAVTSFFRRNKIKDYCLVYADIVAFRRFNAMFGYRLGDELIRAVAECVRNSAYCGCRLNSDVFCFVVRMSDSVARDLQRRFEQGVEAAMGRQYTRMVAFKFGVYPMLQDRFQFREAVDGAMLALRYAKSEPKESGVIYDLDMLKEDKLHRHIEVSMLRALSEREFVMYVQPQFFIENVQWSGGEALVRWQSDQLGVLLPYQFIPLFERNGFIAELDLFMLDQVLMLQQHCKDNNLPIAPISVNQSRATISLPNYLERVRAVAGRYDVPLYQVEIEITESILTRSYESVLTLVYGLREMGFVVAIDDFGKAYSSLSILRELPADILKIDKEFLREADTSHRGRKIIQNIINLARDLEISTVCEGVETAVQLEFLRKAGCDTAQGYYLARPMPCNEYLERYVKNQAAD
jgi:EAL domain-containing protein (putative c-di-GMP-specific phosphodiesterase class I)/GGDEF domain-containing protein